MDRQSALQALELNSDASQQDIVAALTEKKQNLADKKANAPTAALKAKFVTLEKELADIEQALLAQPPSEAPVEPVNTRAPRSNASASLSQTKLADLPLSQQSYSGFDGGEAGAQIQLQSGQVLANRYEIKEQIGAGGMGAVYHAFDRTKQEDIALKVLLPALLQNERARQRFLDEARISARLSHPNIVNVHDVQQDGDFFFLTMELLHGQDLRQLMEARQISRQPFDEAEAQTLAQTLAAALAYAHQHTVHRDIKPENIWVTEDGDYKIMDFGIARVQSTSQRSKSGAVLGTAYYMAPEQLKGTSSIDGRADQYALGVLLYELLSGEVPAGRFKPLRELRKDIGKGFAGAVEKALETRAEERFADIRAFAEALASSKGHSRPTVSLTGRPAAVAAGLLVLLVMGGIAASGLLGPAWEALRPVSEAERIEMQANAVRLQGQANSLIRRLDASRQQLRSDFQDAQRSNSQDMPRLKVWHEVVEGNLFQTAVVAELEGDRAVADSFLRDREYLKASEYYAGLIQSYQALVDQFDAGGDLYSAEQLAVNAKSKWLELQRNYQLSDAPQVQIANNYTAEAQEYTLQGDLMAAINSWKKSAENWQVAQKVFTEDIARIDSERAEQLQKVQAEKTRQALLPFVDNGNGTVTDTRTGLMWMRCELGKSWNGADCVGETQKYRMSSIEGTTWRFAGHNDWRLPTIRELTGIVDCKGGRRLPLPRNLLGGDWDRYLSSLGNGGECSGRRNDDKEPRIHTLAFPSPSFDPNWSSSYFYWEHGKGQDEHRLFWRIYFYTGQADRERQNSALAVRLVRGR